MGKDYEVADASLNANLERQLSNSVEKLSRKMRYFLVAIFVVMLLSVGLTVAAFLISLDKQSPKKETLVVNRSADRPKDDEVQVEKEDPVYKKRTGDEKREEHIEVVGHGNRHFPIRRGGQLRHWKLSTNTGSVWLKYHSYIMIETPGLYRVYAQIAVSNLTPGSTRRVNALLMRNGTKLLGCTWFEGCKRTCTQYLSRNVQLNKGDQLAVKTSTGGTFYMEDHSAFFGVTLIK